MYTILHSTEVENLVLYYVYVYEFLKNQADA